MEEDVTKHAEFPENGVFDLGPLPSSKYKICGESEQMDGGAENNMMMMRPRFAVRGPSGCGPSGWGQSRPWANESFSSEQPGPSNPLLRKKPKYDSSYLKRTIPYVSLTTDASGRNICVDTIMSNVYIRIADDNVCAQTILADIAMKSGAEENELTLLDSKFIPVTDDGDKGEHKHYHQLNL